ARRGCGPARGVVSPRYRAATAHRKGFPDLHRHIRLVHWAPCIGLDQPIRADDRTARSSSHARTGKKIHGMGRRAPASSDEGAARHPYWPSRYPGISFNRLAVTDRGGYVGGETWLTT